MKLASVSRNAVSPTGILTDSQDVEGYLRFRKVKKIWNDFICQEVHTFLDKRYLLWLQICSKDLPNVLLAPSQEFQVIKRIR